VIEWLIPKAMYFSSSIIWSRVHHTRTLCRQRTG
jgi:hypothetical protein